MEQNTRPTDQECVPPVQEAAEDPTEMSFGDHLDALRPHLIRSVIALGLFFVVAFCFKNILIDYILFGPTRPDFPTNRLLDWLGLQAGLEGMGVRAGDFQLVNTSMAGQFNLHVSASLVASLSITFPYLLWELWRFVRPALTPREARGCHRFVFEVSSGFFIGLLFGYFVVAPISIGFLTQYRVSDQVVNMIDVGSYLSTVLTVSLACAVIFQLPLLVRMLTRAGVLSAEFMRTYRRHAFVILAILSAIITPPDAFSMVLVLLPLYGLYELSIGMARRVEQAKKEEG